MRPIAQSHIWYGKDNGERRRITVMICEPEKDPLPGGDYRCPVTFRGLGRKKYVYGVDSLQSLMLAVVFVNIGIDSLSHQGYHFFMNKSGGDALDMRLIWQADGRKLQRTCRTNKTGKTRPTARIAVANY